MMFQSIIYFINDFLSWTILTTLERCGFSEDLTRTDVIIRETLFSPRCELAAGDLYNVA